MYRQIFLYLIIHIFLFFSCSTKEEPESYINIPDLIDNKIDLKMSDVYSEISYTILETNKDIYISKVDGIIANDDYFLVLDNSKYLLSKPIEGFNNKQN